MFRSHFPPMSRISPLFYLLNIVLIKKKTSNTNSFCLNIPECVVFLWNMLTYQDFIPIEGPPFLSWKTKFVKSFMARDETVDPSPISILEFGMAWTCTGFMHGVTLLWTCIYSEAISLQSSITPKPFTLLHLWPLSFVRDYGIHYSFRNEHSAIPYFLHHGQLWGHWLKIT